MIIRHLTKYRMVKNIGGKNFGELLAIRQSFFRQFSQLSIELRMASDYPWQNIRPLVYGSIFSSSVSTSSLYSAV